MLVEHILDVKKVLPPKDVYTIKTECSQFLQESQGLPVFRALPTAYDTFQRVKARQKHLNDNVSQAFNTAFSDRFHNIVARGVFTQSVIMERDGGLEPFYIFPIDGYKFAYSKGVQNANVNFKSVFETLSSTTEDAFSITSDLIKYTYTTKRLKEGIESDSEIIFYNIPYFYAVRVSDVGRYSTLINR